MSSDLSNPFVGGATECQALQWFEYSRSIFQHPGLSQDEKYLWMWLATTKKSADDVKQGCLYSYMQLSQIMNKSCEIIHRMLFTLKILGCLRGALPVTYQKLDEATTHEERKLIPCVPSKIFLDCKEALKEQLKGENFNRDRDFLTQQIRKCLSNINLKRN